MGFYRRNLPHLFIPGFPLFITTRLSKSISRRNLNELHEYLLARKQEIQNGPEESVKKMEEQLQREFFKKYDALLHADYEGPHWLINESVASIVSESLHWGHAIRYDLIAYTIMPNHIHFILKPIVKQKDEQHEKNDIKYYLTEILESFKKYTARKANELLKRKGQFWQHESYDHLLRNKAELTRSIRYIIRDPVRAKFVLDWRDYKWTYLNEKYIDKKSNF